MRISAFVVGFDGPEGFKDAVKEGTIHLRRRGAVFDRIALQEEVGADRAVVIHGFDIHIDLDNPDLHHWVE